MLRAFIVSLMFLGLATVLVLYSQAVANSRYLGKYAAATANMMQDSIGDLEGDLDRLAILARNRSLLYDDRIEEKHLVDGLVVSRANVAGAPLDVCDSLLFSSIRWVALSKLGWRDRAAHAYQSIRSAQVEGGWMRHPECLDRNLSRDMLMGILIILSQGPHGYEEDLVRLVHRVQEGGGYFSDGPSYVSYLTPGLGKILRMLATKAGLAASAMPRSIRDGYSTNEISLLWMEPGFEAHLAGLSLWLELELADQGLESNYPTGLELFLKAMISPFSKADPFSQAHQWTAMRLVRIDPRNIFFRYLLVRSKGSLSRRMAGHLLSDLLRMSQFPHDHLPESCDRTADYLWQRDSREYDEVDSSCSREFSGTDFLWMAGILVPEVENLKDRVHLTN